MLNWKTLVHLSPCVPEIVFSLAGLRLLAMSLFSRDPGKSSHIADIAGRPGLMWWTVPAPDNELR